MTGHVDPPNATVLPAARRGERPVLPPGTEPTTDHLREALDACDVLAKQLAVFAVELRRAERERDQARAEVTAARGRIVDLLYIIDAFQIESGADRNASYETGIAAVRQLRAALGERAEQLLRAQADNAKLRKRLDMAELELHKARMTLRAVAAESDPGTQGELTHD